MAKNQLIIGLGGVGGRSIAAFKKATIQYENEYNSLVKENGYRFEYLYIDSNNDRLEADDWEIYGRSVKLDPADIVLLKQYVGGNTNFSIRAISKQENIEPWIGDFRNSFAKRSGKSNIGDDSLDSEVFGLNGAGQLRRYGRLLFAINAQTVRRNLQSKLERLVKNTESEVDVRIFCTLGGGTGSGAIVDMVTLIKDLEVGGHQYKIDIYTFVAGALRDAQDAGSFYQNEYAALRDLNALMVGKFRPFVVAAKNPGSGDNYHTIQNGQSPIRHIYLSSEESFGTPSLREQIDFMAKACFDTIMIGPRGSEGAIAKALSGEDLVDNNNEPRRSYRFAALGVKRLCVPTEQIKELLRADYAKRVLESWLLGTPLPPNTRRDLSKAVIHFDPRTGIEHWVASVKVKLTSEYDSIVRQQTRDALVLEKMRKAAIQASDNAKKLLGNQEVRIQIEKKSEEDAAEILQLVQMRMDGQMKWSIGGDEAWGLNDVKEFIMWYISQISSWPKECIGDYDNDEIVKLRSSLIDNMGQREEQWAKLGFLTIHLTEKDERMIRNHYEDCCSLVDMALLDFKIYAMEALIDEARKRLGHYSSLVDLAITENEQQTAAIEQNRNKINADLTNNSKSESLCDQYEFDNTNLQRVRQKIAELKKEHRNNMAAIFSPAWTESIGSLAEFQPNKTKALMDNINKRLYTCSEKIHRLATDGSSLQSVLNVSIFDRLLQIAGPTAGLNEENWDNALKDVIQRFFGQFRSSSYVVPLGSRYLTNPQHPPVKALAFSLPEGSKNPDFENWLKKKIDVSIQGEIRPSEGRREFCKHEAAEEIRALYISYWFPASFAPVVNGIYKKYRDSAKDPNDAVKIYFANIDDDDIGLQSKTRPALTEEGEPDEDTARKVDLAARLKIVVGKKEFPVLSETEKGIKILQSLEDGMAEYTKAYSAEERYYPSRTFTKDLDSGISLANGMMDDLQKQAVLRQYREEYDKSAEGSDEETQAKKDHDEAKKVLGL